MNIRASGPAPSRGVAGILSNTTSEVGYVLLVPLGAIIFQTVGRHHVSSAYPTLKSNC